LPVYNLEVANAHTFFVGVDGVEVHNAKKDCGPGRSSNHGDPNAIQRAEKNIEENYAERLKNAVGAARKKLEKTIKNIRETAQKRAKGDHDAGGAGR
jgi:hypothetical protein